MNIKKEQLYTKRIDALNRENKSLKRQIRKLRKIIDKANTNFWDIFDEEPLKENGEKENKNLCEKCGGEFKRLELLEYVFDICQDCKNRKRIK